MAPAVGIHSAWQTQLGTDGTKLWVGDGGNRKIKEVDLQAPYSVTTVAGSGNVAVNDGVGTNADRSPGSSDAAGTA